MAFCPTIVCKMCKKLGHITVNCPKKNQCLICGETNHKQKECPKRKCNTCERQGHNTTSCDRYNLVAIKDTDWTKEEYCVNIKQCRCGCSLREIEKIREHYVKTHISTSKPYDTHCCRCKRPYPMRVLKRGFKKLYLCTINCVNFDQSQEETQETTLDIMEINQKEETSQWNINNTDSEVLLIRMEISETLMKKDGTREYLVV
jgi:hypothetical protein